MYKQMTKAIALVALFLTVGVNAWASETWEGYVSGQTVSVTITTSWANKFVTNLQAKANSQITYSHSGTSGLVGVEVSGTNKLFLKPTTDGYMNLRFCCANGSPLTVTIHDNTDNKDVASVSVVTVAVNNTGIYGETVLFEVVADHEYELQASDSKTYYLTIVTKIENSDIAVVSDEQSESAMQSAIGSGKTLVKMHRTLTAGVWNTFSSPIKLGINAMRAELKCNEAYEMKSYNATDNTITFQKTDNIVAGKPYLIKPTEAVTEINVSNRSNPATYNPQSVSSGNLSFVAALAATNIYTTGDASSTKFFLRASDNKLVYPTSNEGNRGMIKGLRAYFEATGSLVKDMTFIFEDEDDPTGIITVERDIFQENGNVYTVDGRLVGNSKENLSRGIYIQNGRKFIVK